MVDGGPGGKSPGAAHAPGLSALVIRLSDQLSKMQVSVDRLEQQATAKQQPEVANSQQQPAQPPTQPARQQQPAQPARTEQRTAALMQLMERSNQDVAGMSAEELGLFGDFMRTPLEQDKQRSFKNYKDFMRVYSPFMEKMWAKDKAAFLSHYKYQCFITELAMERSWPAADLYHWEFFRAVRDGTHQVSQPCNLRVLMEVNNQFPVKKSGGSAGTPGSSYCNTHGWCGHVTSDCKQKAGNGGAAERPPPKK